MPLVRPLLVAVAALALPGTTNSPTAAAAPNAGANATPSGGSGASVLTSLIHFRGQALRAPPGVRMLAPETLLLGTVSIDVPQDVTFEFNEQGEAVFKLREGVRPRAWVLTVGKRKLVASAGATAVVPLPGVGAPRIQWSRFAYPVPAPSDHLTRVRDLKDPFDASPYR